MKVLHFYKSYYPDGVGGVEKVIHQICESCIEYGIESEVLTLTSKGDISDVMVDGHQVYRCKTNMTLASTPFSFSVLWRFYQLAKSVDIIHLHFPYPFADLTLFLTMTKKPVVITYHSDIVKQQYFLRLYRPLKHYMMNKAKYIVATSPNYLRTSSVLSKYNNKVNIIPIAINEADYPVDPITLGKWKRKVGDEFFLFVGVLRYYKGLHILLEAAQGKPYPIVIMGAGPIEHELKLQAKRLGLKNVTFVGGVSNSCKAAIFSLCRAVVFPSHLRSEAFGITLLEGAMFGKPLISSEIGTGTSYINIHNETGYVVAPSDPHAFGQAMDKLWFDDKKAQELGMQARLRYEKYFQVDGMAQSYVNLYNQCKVDN